MAFTLCTSLAATYKAGKNCSTTVLASTAILESFSNDAEGYIEAETNTDWTTNYSARSTSTKNVLSDIASSLVAMKMISYDLGGYDSQRQAETILDINDNISKNGLQVLKGKADRRKTP